MCNTTPPPYPTRILPQSGWGKHFHGKNFSQHKRNAIIGRRLNGKLEDCIVSNPINGDLSIEAEYLQSGDIINLSTSLLGAAYLIDDFAYVSKEDGVHDWDTGLDIDLANFKEGTDYYYYTSAYCVVGWPILNLEGFMVPFNYNRTHESYEAFVSWQESLPMNHDNAEISKYLGEFKKISKTENDKFPSQLEVPTFVKIIHRPTNLNYWHLTVDIFPIDKPETELVKEDVNKKSYKKKLRRIADELRTSFILCNANAEIPKIDNWNEIAMTGNWTS